MADAGWFTDPTGRFGQRWYDGSAWTKNVVGASGGVLEDALPDSDTPFPPPAGPAANPAPSTPVPPAPAPPAAQHPQGGYPPQGGAYGPAAPTVRYGVGAGLVLGLIGVVLVALSLFAVSWAKGPKTRFTDLTSEAHKADPTRFPDFGVHLNFVYISWLAYVLFAAVVVLTVLAGIPVPRTGVGNRFWRIGASLLAGVAATIHSVTVTYTFVNTGQTAGFGALSALFGYFVIMIGMIFGARRIVRPPGRPW